MKKYISIIILTIFINFFPLNTFAKSEGWEIINGKTYYYENGIAVKGFKKINNKLYFLVEAMIHICEQDHFK